MFIALLLDSGLTITVIIRQYMSKPNSPTPELGQPCRSKTSTSIVVEDEETFIQRKVEEHLVAVREAESRLKKIEWEIEAFIRNLLLFHRSFHRQFTKDIIIIIYFSYQSESSRRHRILQPNGPR